MSEIRVASRYAKSLFDLAIERGSRESVHKDASTLLELVSSNRTFANLLKSPIIQTDKKWHVIEKIFKGKFDSLTMDFIKIVLRKRRDIVLPDIFRQFNEMYNNHMNIISATVYTAVPISDKIKEEVQHFLAKRSDAKIELTNEINKELLGGFVLKYEDKMVDASVSTQLRTLRNRLINAN
jgi:F-type H+-transporting ATPase subunit delta